MRKKGAVNNYVAYRLRELRVERGMSSQEASRRSGIAPGSFSCLENGHYRINIDSLYRMLFALNADIGEVWPGADRTDGPVDERFVEDAVAEALQRIPRKAELDDVFDAVCQTFEVAKDKLLSTSRWGRLQEARAVCGMLVKEFDGIRLRSLAQSLRLPVSSLSHLVGRHRRRLGDDPKFAARVAAARKLVLKTTRNPSLKVRQAG